MPTLLDMCGIEVPDSVDGISMASDARRDYLYGEWGEDDSACRMVRDDRYKLIYYPVGNVFQLFDLQNDPDEMIDLSGDPAHDAALSRLTETLKDELYGSDLDWFDGSELVGLPDKRFKWRAQRDLYLQRGETWPPSSNCQT